MEISVHKTIQKVCEIIGFHTSLEEETLTPTCRPRNTERERSNFKFMVKKIELYFNL